MSADYLDLLLGRATGAIPAAEPRIHSAMAAPPALPAWGDVTEERITPYAGITPAPYRSDTSAPPHAVPAYIPRQQQSGTTSVAGRDREEQDRPDTAERKTTQAGYASPQAERHVAPVGASADLLPPPTEEIIGQAEEAAPPTGRTVLQAPLPQTRDEAERTQPARVQQPQPQPVPTARRQSTETPSRSLLPGRQFAPPLTSAARSPQSAPEIRNASASTPTPVTIRIDRIEVHAAPPAKAPVPPAGAKQPAVRLDDYLARRKGAAR